MLHLQQHETLSCRHTNTWRDGKVFKKSRMCYIRFDLGKIKYAGSFDKSRILHANYFKLNATRVRLDSDSRVDSRSFSQKNKEMAIIFENCQVDLINIFTFMEDEVVDETESKSRRAVQCRVDLALTSRRGELNSKLLVQNILRNKPLE